MKKLIVWCCLMAIVEISQALPPLPPLGYRWVLQPEFSDEFDGDKLDSDKWYDYYPGWQGRPPARFEPRALSVSDGYLLIQNGAFKKPVRDYSMYGGAVVSKSSEAHFGYYECRFKASKIGMSTTFWLSNDKEPFEETDCPGDSYSQELDIQECVGGNASFPKFEEGMNSNTHYRYVKCEGGRENFISKGAGTKLSSEVTEDFHTYAAWWRDAEEVYFYADDEFFQSVRFSKDISQQPFDRPMHVNMVTETYDWQPAPSVDELQDKSINTSYYDWIRAYKLVPVDQRDMASESVELDLYDNKIYLQQVPKGIFQSRNFSLEYVFSSNENAKVLCKIVEREKKETKTVQSSEWSAYAGFGRGQVELELNFNPALTKTYQLELDLVSEDSGEVLKRVSYDLSN
ncbi:family 16 glycosylhydrolase [Reichenbachiella agarivorans]|uniref:Family 16 glycosylhydrolase n=1 Tax=Reichenbachiella agarivorans TaxID=2979464 RepID=A0ABY6CRH6_9BACT|nr:family 16 glycosylhydrolase [Reichenbachiella agarivorans]UXP32063.1 family 16 glycosylhydrolase [Reichenbachiella agarivorans]